MTGMNAAHQGGIGTVIDMPNTIPPTDAVGVFMKKLRMAAKVPGILIAAGLTNNCVEKYALKNLMKHTSIFKVFLANSTGNLAINEVNLRKGLKLLSKGKNLLMIHAEDPRFIKERDENSNELEVRPEIAEIEAIKFVTELAGEYDEVNFHVTHVSTLVGAELLLRHEQITWDVLPKYLDFSQDIVKSKGNYAKMNPPLRLKKDMLGLNSLLKMGKIPIISSDHAPHTREEKRELVAGAPGVQELYPFLIDRYLRGELKREIMEDVIVNNPKSLLKRVGVEVLTGTIEVDTNAMTRVDEKFIASKCGWSLWSGREFKGKIVSLKLD